MQYTKVVRKWCHLFLFSTIHTHFGFTILGSEMHSFKVIAVCYRKFWFGSPCIPPWILPNLRHIWYFPDQIQPVLIWDFHEIFPPLRQISNFQQSYLRLFLKWSLNFGVFFIFSIVFQLRLRVTLFLFISIFKTSKNLFLLWRKK